MWISNSNFIEKDIPKLHPLTEEYRYYWKEQKRRCIEGYWSGGKWMTPNLYFYVNFWNILLNKTATSKAKTTGRPLLFDIFWELSYYWAEARGLTGFTGQQEVMDLYNYYINDHEKNDEKEEYLRSKIRPIREVLRDNTLGDLGKPLYITEAQNLMMMGNRGYGKSYFTAGAVIAHEWLFDGLKEYNDDILLNIPSTEVLVGAGDAKYSEDLLKKVKFGIDRLAGGFEIGNKYYPAPLGKQYKGSWAANSEILAEYEKKIGGTWKPFGSRSKIKHRTYKDNPFAASGTRPAVAVKEEIGLFDNLKAACEADVETQRNGTYKFGSTFMLGTGGDMDGGTIDASEMFYDPLTYNILYTEDIWENKGKIGYFVPAYRGLAQFKDSEGRTLEDTAKKYLEDHREKIRKGKNSGTALDAEIQNRPLVPSEMFLSKSGNIFPKKEIQQWLAVLEGSTKYQDAEWVGELVFDEEGKVIPQQNAFCRPIRKYPLNMKKDEHEGAIVIWEHPYIDPVSNQVPEGIYVAGTDPYDHDESGTQSLGSTFIYKKFIHFDQWNHLPVAEYTGRPKADSYYEGLRKLLMYYNARCLYENEKKGVHQYLERKSASYLLFDQPDYIKEVIPMSTVVRNKGIHMAEALKVHGEELIKNWLEEEYAPGKLNITKIRSIPLLKELLAYNRKHKVNTDRVMAFMCVMYAIKETERNMGVNSNKVVRPHEQDFFKTPIVHNKTASTLRDMQSIISPERYNSLDNKGLMGW